MIKKRSDNLLKQTRKVKNVVSYKDRSSAVLFSNLESGKNRLDLKRYRERRRLNKLREIIGDGDTGRVYTTGNPRDTHRNYDYLEDVDDKMMRACKENPDFFVIDGGDGSCCTYMTALDRHWKKERPPLVAILGGGTFNNLYKGLGVRNVFRFLRNVVNSDLNDLTLKTVQLMRIDDDNGNKHLSFSTGVGFPVDLLEETYRKKHLKYAWIAAMTMRGLSSAAFGGEYYKKFDKKQRFTVTGEGIDGYFQEDTEWLGVLAQSIKSLGIPKYAPVPEIFRKAEESEGYFHAVGITVGFKKFLKNFSLHPLIRSKFYERTFHLDHQLKSKRIESNEPFAYQSCGDIYPLARELRIGPGRNFDIIKDYF